MIAQAKSDYRSVEPTVGVASEQEITTYARVTAFPPDKGTDTRHELEASAYLTFQTGGCVNVKLRHQFSWQSADGERNQLADETSFYVDPDVLPSLAQAFASAVDRATALKLQAMVDALPDPIDLPPRVTT